MEAAFGESGALLAAGVGAGALLSAAILEWCTGGIVQNFGIILDGIRATRANPYAIATMTGPFYLLPQALHALGPITIELAAMGIASAIVMRGRPGMAGLACAVVAFLAVFALIPHWMNLRYISPSYGPLCLFAGTGVYTLGLISRQRLPNLAFRASAFIGIAVIAGSLVMDYQRFRRYDPQLTDLSVRQILDQARASTSLCMSAF